MLSDRKRKCMENLNEYLKATETIDCDNQEIKAKTEELTANKANAKEKAISLFYFVRDEISYNFFVRSNKPEYYKASRILKIKNGFCIQKAVLMAALCRSAGIPARLRMAILRNHLAPPRLRELLNGNILPTHGYNELFIDGKWIKVAPTFNIEMCRKNNFVPVEFDGEHDATLPAYDKDGKPHMEYVKDNGAYADLPMDLIIKLRIEYLGADIFERMEYIVQTIEKKKGLS